jgi:hypothetical protein
VQAEVRDRGIALRHGDRVRRMVRNSVAKRRYACWEQASGAGELAAQLDPDTPIG